jgi:staphylococcal nuclease domain-containing protein 1
MLIMGGAQQQQFAFDSRDYLRKSLVGRTVTFKPLYTIPTTQRQYGVLLVPGGPSFPERAVVDGWVRLRDDAGRKDESAEATSLLERLQVAEARAKADEKGVWQEKGGKVDCSYEVQGDAKKFVEEHKAKSLDGRLWISLLYIITDLLGQELLKRYLRVTA